MIDEADIHLDGYVNKQNARLWASENPKVIHQLPLQAAKVTVWCAVSRIPESLDHIFSKMLMVMLCILMGTSIDTIFENIYCLK